jgi:hypothetical protein
MERDGDELHLSESEASGGEQPHIVRRVLGISLVLAIALLSAIWIIGAITLYNGRAQPVLRSSPTISVTAIG